ncbi:SusD/RagB family nutrient-binding outer membrane lipoprotein [Chitinophaga pendula]|uniref:SusD/RagB family nutrient-binding outer membrane lipoprotein n=1 Tax=Chitinophaga TaxID=79328 RepID=UPI000BAE88F6|nr:MULTISPECIES: SusD/RagB family nutrient-binding outer membrane lipoprotein [Chitinophaga]ASZ11483.1 SusD/RagB family nutrient-binding outer membrane lipoprotein [Chitinophaga sp. MD30]UCJ05508.1 SusD/RagB family nutrient-binding outer membrane lipoprotein [Chitinophaga pendula]
MKASVYKTLLLLAIPTATLLTGCTKNFEDINTDKNQATPDTYKPEYNLTRAQLEFSGNNDFSYDTWRVNIIYCGMMTQQLANVTWYAGDKYMSNPAHSAASFDVAYNDQVKYIVDMINLTKNKPQYSNLHQIGRIMRAFIMHRLTDIYGDIPYSEAGRGYSDRILTPKYDKQEDIYRDMLKELDEATKALDATKDVVGKNDLIYGGNPDKWKRLGYSLMVRLGMRLSKIDGPAAKTWVEKAAQGGIITGNEENAYIQHDLGGGRVTVNRNSNVLGSGGPDDYNATGWDRSKSAKTEVFLSKTFIDYLKNNNDPRLQYMALVRGSGVTTPSAQIGLPNGYDINGGATDIKTAPNYPGDLLNYSTIRGDVLLKPTGITVFLTYGQTELLLAEAAQRGWNVGGSAADHYNKGVTASMQQLAQYDAKANIGDAAIQAYLAAHPYDGAKGLEQINSQYWVASFLDWYEVWSNWRRSGYPVLVPVNYVGNATGGTIPRRLPYPTAEIAANNTNYAAAVARQGSDVMTTRMWWDKQ